MLLASARAVNPEPQNSKTVQEAKADLQALLLLQQLEVRKQREQPVSVVHQGLPAVKCRPATPALEVLAVGRLQEAPLEATEAQAAGAGAVLEQGQCLLGAGIAVLEKDPQVLIRTPAARTVSLTGKPLG